MKLSLAGEESTGMRMGQDGVGWGEGGLVPQVSREKTEDGGWAQLLKDFISPTKVSGLRACLSPWQVLKSAMHQLLQPVWRIGRLGGTGSRKLQLLGRLL